MSTEDPEQGRQEAPGWRQLDGAEFEAVWGRFEQRFSFREGSEQADWPGIEEPIPSLTWDISGVYVAEADGCARLLANLRLKVLRALRACTPRGEELHVLVRLHGGFAFDPHAPEAEDVGAWRVPVVPDGIYTVFVAPNLRFGVFGHPWEMTVCVFGRGLVTACEADPPLLFKKLVRRDGLRV